MELGAFNLKSLFTESSALNHRSSINFTELSGLKVNLRSLFTELSALNYIYLFRELSALTCNHKCLFTGNFSLFFQRFGN